MSSCELAGLYALGTLPADEAQAYESHLQFCEACRTEIGALRPVVAAIGLTAPEADPPEDLRARLKQRLDVPASTLSRAADDAWEASGVPGVDVRRLFVDAASQRQTILVRMQPGASYPTHAHAGTEECYVVEGDLIDGPLRMTAGDYVCYREGTQHGPLSTEQGCLLLVQSSLHDEVVDG